MANINAATMGMIPVGSYEIRPANEDATITIPDDATGIYFQFRLVDGFYLWGDDADTPGINADLFIGPIEIPIRLDLYPGCPFRYATTGTGQISYLFFRAIDHESLATRQGR